MDAQVIFKHISEKDEKIIFTGNVSECKKHIALQKRMQKRYSFDVWEWCNGGFCVPNMFYIELRKGGL